ncbi:hypothetical protein ACW0JT_14615 [Arthrobacter sp. SA17]
MDPLPPSAATPDEPLAPEFHTELQAAWAELTEAANASRVTTFHACTRTGRHWTEDPAAIRDIAATLSEFPFLNNQQKSARDGD